MVGKVGMNKMSARRERDARRRFKDMPPEADPLQFLLDTMVDEKTPLGMRVDCAKAACKFIHPALQSIELEQTSKGKSHVDWMREIWEREKAEMAAQAEDAEPDAAEQIA